MTIDLTRFATEQNVILPITHQVGKIRSRVVKAAVEDGWYLTTLGDQAKVVRKATQLEVYRTIQPLPKLKLYSFGNEGIPVNFDVFAKRGYQESVRVYFLEQPTFTVAKAAVWEDGKLYFFELDQVTHHQELKSLKLAFDRGHSLTHIKGVTPELRYYFLLNNLQKQTLASLEQLKSMNLSAGEISKRINDMKQTVEFRIKDAVEKAGGTFVSFAKRGTKFLVVWQIGDQEVKSIIKDDLRIDSAGFCLSGDDKRHSLNSIVNLAKLFKRSQPLYITRE